MDGDPAVSASAMALPRLPMTPRRWLSFAAHCFKATVAQHHRDLVPVFRPLLAEDAVIFDVGAHAGQFTKLFARLAPRGRVYAFEPGSYARSILMLSLALNRVANVLVFPVGLGAAARRAELRTPVKRSGSYGFGLSHIGEDEDSTRREAVERIEIVTLDGLCDLLGIERLDFIKADIEGWELQMLKGGAATLRRLRPKLWLEVHDRHLARAGDSAGALRDFLAAEGYVAYRVDERSGLYPAPAEGEGDFLFLPGEASVDKGGASL
jgi:FkbM family methyltransferase